MDRNVRAAIAVALLLALLAGLFASGTLWGARVTGDGNLGASGNSAVPSVAPPVLGVVGAGALAGARSTVHGGSSDDGERGGATAVPQRS